MDAEYWQGVAKNIKAISEALQSQPSTQEGCEMMAEVSRAIQESGGFSIAGMIEQAKQERKNDEHHEG